MDDFHYNPDFIVNHTKDGINSEKASKRLCKVLKFHVEFSLIENLNYISMLNPTLFPCLFVFVIEIKSLNEFQEIQIEDHFFYRFDKTRPIVLQIKAGNDSKWFYSEENKTQFVCINEGHDDYMHLSILLWKFSKNNNKQDIEELIDVLIDEFSDIKNTSTVLRFLTNLTISDETLFSIMLQCALNGSQDEFSSFLNDSFDKEHRIFNANTQKLLSYYQIDEATQNKISVLLQAVENPRGDVIDYLISNCTHLIQELPYHHRVKVSEYAMTINKFGILCDLIEFSDFPFPHLINDSLILNERFSKISNDRKLFHKSICDDNIDQIQSFINKNQNLKFAFNIDNKSALACAMELKKFKTYTDLKSKGFKINDGEIKDYEKDLKKKELMEWKKQIWIQTQKNVAEAKLDPKKLIYHFKSRSLIHKRMITKEAEAKNRTKIEEMFENINKIPICSKFLLVASQCEDLKFIFDFDSESVENVDVKSGSQTVGVTYPIKKWIFIGAKETLENHSKIIEGVLMHEISHYVMRLTFENAEKPYFKNDKKAETKFDKICTAVNKWSENIENEVENFENSSVSSIDEDDDCEGIISSVFTDYEEKDYHPELIVRPLQIVAQFNENGSRLVVLKNKYKLLFDYIDKFVLPELENCNIQIRKSTRYFNRMIGDWLTIENENFQLKSTKIIRKHLKYNLLIIISNIPKLAIRSIFQCIQTNNLPDVSNLFISSESLKKSEIFENFKSITCENQNIKVIIDCSRGSNNYFKQLNDLNLKLIVVLGNKNQLIELEEMLTSQHFSQSKAVKELYFTFEDLTVECQLSLVQKKIKFQNNSNLTLEEILTNNVAESFDDGLYKKIIDDELLKLLVENPLVSINTNSKTGDDDKFFDILFQPRNLVNTKSGLNEVVSEDSLFANVNSMKNILISDLGGTGKSWMLKKITQILNKKVPKTWVSYIDLKQHIQAFKKMHTKSYFPHFLGEEILKLESNYEKQIFNCLFENGRTILLFDGFDEISQDCAKNLLNLLKSFESNNGNQLWIATRNYCEEYLQNEINFDATFNLEEITEENGIDLVIHTWLLEETPNIENDLKSHHNYAKYKKMVENLGSKLPKKKGRPIGFPLFYKMIANVYSNEKDSIDILTVFVIVHGFVTQQCRRWMSEKGECGIEAAIKSQNKNYGYFLIHQLLALRSMFPEKKKICSLDYDKHKWSDKCINNCGLATKNGGLVYFQHEIIREFFVAMFILDILRQSPDSIDEDFISLLKDLFTNYKFNVIRIFINDGIIQDTETIDSNHQANVSLENITEQLICERVLLKLFKEGHVNLMKIFMPLTPSSDHYEMVEGTLNQTIKEIIEITQSNEKIIEILKLIINFLTDDDLKNLFWEQEIFQNIMKLRSDITILETIAAMLEIKTGKLFVEKLLEKKCLDNRNCFYFLYKSDYCDEKNFKILFLFLQKYLSKCVIVKMIKQCDNNTNNILHICVKMMNVEKLKIMWKEIQNVCDSLKSLLCFKELIIQNESILHVAASCDNEHFHETLWTLIHQTYPEMNELSKLIIHKDKSGSSFLDLLVKNKNHKILECSLNFIIRIPFKDILNLKNKDGKNLLHFSICTCKTDTRIHNILWNHLKHQIVSSNIVKEILLQTDNEDNTIFELMAIHSSKKVFTFIIQNIISILEEEFITILKCLNNQKKNLIQIAVKNNFDLEFHEQLWKVLNKYLDSNDILKIIQSIDTSGNTLLMLAVLYNNQSCVELTWNEIANHVKGKIERHEYLNIVGLEGISLLDLSRKNRFKGVNLFVGELLNKITINGHPYGEALNLLKFEKDNKVVIDIKKLQSILEQKDVRNRKIVAFSIIGAMRKGKSYFLNYCLRFLYANVSNTSIFN
ncbi:hypothetical protein ACKWTF_016155 [Chironomus riparius]